MLGEGCVDMSTATELENILRQRNRWISFTNLHLEHGLHGGNASETTSGRHGKGGYAFTFVIFFSALPLLVRCMAGLAKGDAAKFFRRTTSRFR